MALAVEIDGIEGTVARLDGTRARMPRTISIEVDASKTPHPKVHATFEDADDAEVAVDWLYHDVKQQIESRRELKFTIGSLYRSAKIHRDGATVTVSVPLTASQANLLLDITEGFLEQVTGHNAARDARRRTLRETNPPAVTR